MITVAIVYWNLADIYKLIKPSGPFWWRAIIEKIRERDSVLILVGQYYTSIFHYEIHYI